MALQPQWNLDASSDSILSVAKGVFRAATSDNVSPLALLACERFGNTLAMSQDACRKIETAVIPTPAPATVQFLRGVVGYSRDDCATQLGKSQAGVQFLGLAAAMIITMSPFGSATALHNMLKSSAADKTMLPPTSHLKELLKSLEHRCQLSGFMDSVIGWQAFLAHSETENHIMCSQGPYCPSPKGVEDLVDAFRQLSRLGQSTVIKATIRTSECVPWVVAFTKWCLGMPPSVFLGNGLPILEQPDTRVIIIASNNTKNPFTFEVEIHHSIPSLSALLVSEMGEKWVGMVSIASYGKWLLKKSNFERDDSFRTVEQLLPFALKQVVSLMILPSRMNKIDSKDLFMLDLSRHDDPLNHLTPIPFPDDQTISTTLSCVLDKQNSQGLRLLEEGLLIKDLPLAKLYLMLLGGICECKECSEAAREFLPYHCLKTSFFRRIAVLTADILALSLFRFPELLHVLVQPDRESTGFSEVILDILTTGERR